MTASAERRRRFTIVGALLAAAGLVSVIIVSSVAVATLRSSQEGRAPEAEQRPIVVFPDTPNAAIGIVDDLDRLSAMAVLTLDPSGIGGSIVVVPVNVDQTNGFGPDRLPVSRRPYAPGDDEQTATFVSKLEPLLSLTIEQAMVVGPAELSKLLEPLGPFDVDLSTDVVDSDTPGSGVIVPSGKSTLDAPVMADAFASIDGTATSYAHHLTDVELWEAVADAPVIDVELPLDDNGRPTAPRSFDEVWQRLFAGDVGVRDLNINWSGAHNADNETETDFVLVDRWDALLVFGAVSPGLVSTPNESLTVSLVVGFEPDEVGALGEAVDGTPITKSSMTRRFIGELLFAGANVVGVDLATTAGGVPATTQLIVADESMEAAARSLGGEFFENAEVTVAERLIDGVDVVAVLGADFLELRAELLAVEREAAAEATGDEDRADFDISGQNAATSVAASRGSVVDSAADGDSSRGTVASDG